MERLKKGDLVMLNGWNIWAKHACQTLEDKMLGPFKVLSVGSNSQYCKLRLPDMLNIHPVINIELLDRSWGKDPKKQVIENEAGGNDWVMESIIASVSLDNNPKRLIFLVKWKDYTYEENTWET